MTALLLADAPEWVQGVLAYHDYELPLVVELCNQVALPGAVRGRDTVTVYAHDNDTGEISGVCSGGEPADNPFIHDRNQRCVLNPCEVDPLDSSIMLLRLLEANNGYSRATLYAHPDHAPHLIFEAIPIVEWAVKVVLVATKRYKAAYNNNMDNRKGEAMVRTGIGSHEFDEARQACIDAGYLTKRKILTRRGFRIAGDTTLEELRGKK